MTGIDNQRSIRPKPVLQRSVHVQFFIISVAHTLRSNCQAILLDLDSIFRVFRIQFPVVGLTIHPRNFVPNVLVGTGYARVSELYTE